MCSTITDFSVAASPFVAETSGLGYASMLLDNSRMDDKRLSLLALNVLGEMERCGLNPNSLTKEAGVGPGSVSDLVKGRKQNMSAENLEKVAARLGRTSRQLLGLDPMPLAPEAAGSKQAVDSEGRSIKAALHQAIDLLQPAECLELLQTVMTALAKRR